MHDVGMKNRLNTFLKEIAEERRNKKREHFDNKLDRLIDTSPWTLYSQGDSIVNLSIYKLSTNQKGILGYGLGFSLPHEKSHFIDVMEELERFKFYQDNSNYSFILMNIENIFYDLKTEMKDFLPKRFLLALKSLKNEKSIRISKADKGGKIVIVDKKDYDRKIKNVAR